MGLRLIAINLLKRYIDVFQLASDSLHLPFYIIKQSPCVIHDKV
jgi:hypothetical protein